MQDLINKKIVLGVCGGIAAYKSAYLVRELISQGASVRVVMTDHASQFISPLTFQALSGNDVRTSLFDRAAEQAMGHIELARWADYLVVCPASAHCIAKFSHGFADDLLSTLYLAAECPIILSPAMNKNMWHHPATQQNCARLCGRGVIIVGPELGHQACGDYGLGRLSEPQSIINTLTLYSIANCLAKQQVLITAGPTQEAIDPVRFVSNHSSGKMGYALAHAALIAGAKTTLISGPCALKPPQGIIFYPVTSANDMHQQVMSTIQPGMIVIACAAVADFSPNLAADEKIKKSDASVFNLSLKLNPDIIASVVNTGKARYTVGFAAETTNIIGFAKAKRDAKKLDMIVANQVGLDVGFNQDNNQVTVITHDKELTLPLMSKVRLAGKIISMIAKALAQTVDLNQG